MKYKKWKEGLFEKVGWTTYKTQKCALIYLVEIDYMGSIEQPISQEEALAIVEGLTNNPEAMMDTQGSARAILLALPDGMETRVQVSYIGNDEHFASRGSVKPRDEWGEGLVFDAEICYGEYLSTVSVPPECLGDIVVGRLPAEVLRTLPQPRRYLVWN